jgi:nitrite reductase/ring-hydroxylating ferredoxin subunit
MDRVPLGDDDLGEGQVRIVRYAAGKPPRMSFLVVRSEAGLRVFWNVCRHLPIPLDAGMGGLAGGADLVCLTHGARYRTSDGHCFAGPCEGEGLEAVEFEVEDGRIFALVP